MPDTPPQPTASTKKSFTSKNLNALVKAPPSLKTQGNGSNSRMVVLGGGKSKSPSKKDKSVKSIPMGGTTGWGTKNDDIASKNSITDPQPSAWATNTQTEPQKSESAEKKPQPQGIEHESHNNHTNHGQQIYRKPGYMEHYDGGYYQRNNHYNNGHLNYNNQGNWYNNNYGGERGQSKDGYGRKNYQYKGNNNNNQRSGYNGGRSTRFRPSYNQRRDQYDHSWKNDEGNYNKNHARNQSQPNENFQPKFESEENGTELQGEKAVPESNQNESQYPNDDQEQNAMEGGSAQSGGAPEKKLLYPSIVAADPYSLVHSENKSSPNQEESFHLENPYPEKIDHKPTEKSKGEDKNEKIENKKENESKVTDIYVSEPRGKGQLFDPKSGKLISPENDQNQKTEAKDVPGEDKNEPESESGPKKSKEDNLNRNESYAERKRLRELEKNARKVRTDGALYQYEEGMEERILCVGEDGKLMESDPYSEAWERLKKEENIRSLLKKKFPVKEVVFAENVKFFCLRFLYRWW